MFAVYLLFLHINRVFIKQQTIMRKIITFISALILSLATSAQTLEGSWTGKLNVMGTQLNIVFNITKGDAGAFSCTLDSPDQGVKGIPAEITVSGGVDVKISVAAIMATYEGRLADGRLKGTLTQSGVSFPLEMKPGKVERNRPQTPKEPYPYATEEVTFTNTADGAVFSGTLTYPVGYEKMAESDTPIVIMVTGSGQQNRDEEVFDHKPFLVLADHLARNGIASLRYDDRGTGKSTGDTGELTTETNMEDALAAVSFVRQTGRFDSTGVLGHSEGGAIAFMLGARGKADFIVSMAGPGVKGDSVLIGQNRLALAASGIQSQFVEAYCKALGCVLGAIEDGRAMEQPESTVQAAVRQTGVNLPEPLVQNLNTVISQCTPWLKHFVGYDPSADIRAVKCPVMAVNGGKDAQVISADNLSAIRRLALANAVNIVKEYPELNHLFQHCTTGLPTEYAQIEETMSPEVMQDIADWINKVARK